MNLNFAQKLGVISEDDRRTSFGDLWREGPVVIAFVRHFG